MTTYNGQRFLKEQLGSILAQSRRIDELVVCDDGSVDDTVNILNEFASGAPFPVKIVVNEDNLGSTKNFEKAMSICTGDIIILCDQDDVWLPDKVKILENEFLTNPNCWMAFTDAEMVDESNNSLGTLWARVGFGKKEQKLLKKGKGLQIFARGNVVTGATAAITKPLFKEATPFPAMLVHDRWLATVAVLKEKLFFCEVITINYRKHSSQQLGTQDAKSFLQRAGNVFDYDKDINTVRIMLNELDNRVYLTTEQNKIFTDIIDFYLFRKNISRNVFTRALKITERLFSGDYHKFASGFFSAAKDLVK